jgi:hypothetical protein
MASRLGVWRLGKMLVLFNGSALPARCIGCGAAEETRPLVLRLCWLPMWMRLLGEFVFIVLGFARWARMEVSLCAACHKRRIAALRWAGICLAAGAVLLCFAVHRLAKDPAALSALLFLTAAFFLRRARPVTVRRIVHGVVYVRGAAPGYLAELPIGGPPGIGMNPDVLADRLEHVRNERRRKRKRGRKRGRHRRGQPSSGMTAAEAVADAESGAT